MQQAKEEKKELFRMRSGEEVEVKSKKLWHWSGGFYLQRAPTKPSNSGPAQLLTLDSMTQKADRASTYGKYLGAVDVPDAFLVVNVFFEELDNLGLVSRAYDQSGALEGRNLAFSGKVFS